MAKIALVTGATSGIGRATAHCLAESGWQLVLCGRRLQRLEALFEALKSKTECTWLAFDVADERAVEEAFYSLPEAWQAVDLLVNNAGNAFGFEPVDEGRLEDWHQTVDTNVKGFLNVTHTVLPGMVERGNGHIINMGSVAGRDVYPNGNAYCGSKAFVEAFNEGMRRDLLGKGVKVSHVAPGAVQTEFSEVRFKGDKERAQQVYEGFQPLSAEDVAEAVCFIANRPAHVNISDIELYPKGQAGTAQFDRSGRF